MTRNIQMTVPFNELARNLNMSFGQDEANQIRDFWNIWSHVPESSPFEASKPNLTIPPGLNIQI